MNDEKPAFIGKAICLFAGALVVLLILYVAASGPVLVVAAKDAAVTNHYVYVSQMPIQMRDPLSQQPSNLVERFYSPLFRIAASTHLNASLSAYLHFWGAFESPVCGSQMAIIPERPRNQ
jgi:hypothetical protein